MQNREPALDRREHKMARSSMHRAKWHVRKGGFHQWLGKEKDAPITKEDIARGKASNNEHVRKMSQFAENAQNHFK